MMAFLMMEGLGLVWMVCDCDCEGKSLFMFVVWSGLVWGRTWFVDHESFLFFLLYSMSVQGDPNSALFEEGRKMSRRATGWHRFLYFISSRGKLIVFFLWSDPAAFSTSPLQIARG